MRGCLCVCVCLQGFESNYLFLTECTNHWGYLHSPFIEDVYANALMRVLKDSVLCFKKEKKKTTKKLSGVGLANSNVILIGIPHCYNSTSC